MRSFLSGDRYTVQVADIQFPNSRGSSYEGLIFSREPQEDEKDSKKSRQPFRFNMPLRTLTPLRGALGEIENSADNNNETKI